MRNENEYVRRFLYENPKSPQNTEKLPKNAKPNKLPKAERILNTSGDPVFTYIAFQVERFAPWPPVSYATGGSIFVRYLH